MRAYVIDDDPIMLQLLTHLLREAGHEVISSQSSGDALGDALARRPNFILLDIMMPGLDGLEFCRRVREHAELSATKVIIVTAKNYEFDRRRATAVGADGYITKPLGRTSPVSWRRCWYPASSFAIGASTARFPSPVRTICGMAETHPA